MPHLITKFDAAYLRAAMADISNNKNQNNNNNQNPHQRLSRRNVPTADLQVFRIIKNVSIDAGVTGPY